MTTFQPAKLLFYFEPANKNANKLNRDSNVFGLVKTKSRFASTEFDSEKMFSEKKKINSENIFIVIKIGGKRLLRLFRFLPYMLCGNSDTIKKH